MRYHLSRWDNYMFRNGRTKDNICWLSKEVKVHE